MIILLLCALISDKVTVRGEKKKKYPDASEIIIFITSVREPCAATSLCLHPLSYRRTGHRPKATPAAPEPDSSSSAAICPPPPLLGGADLLEEEWRSSLEAPTVPDPEGAGTGRRMKA